tara:strand:- start:141 stop:338 length:198 start_codon:yes stop_codon:yes gene_type:complete
MEKFTLAELGLFVGTIGGVIVSLIFALQKSRCENIDCCGIKCKRKLKDDNLGGQDLANAENQNNP